MRNLTLSATTTTPFQNANVTATAIDLDQNAIYASSEKLHLDGDVDIEIWKMEVEGASPPTTLATFNTIATSHGLETHQVISFRVLPEQRKLSVITRTGDITTVPLDDDETPEVEGTVESGILAAAWSPDDTLLVLVTGEDKLVLMTSTFDVLSEAPISTNEFGEDAPINVGWGSKQTQFHGSLGKTAAQVTAPANIGCSSDDDAVPRISWRGDGAFFVVSTLSLAGNNMRRRTLRVYNREAALQSTSEPVAGLEHTLVWRPSGNLIVSTQRFGFEGGGAGKEGKHDLVFFERNGLRHGEFGIRAADLGSKERNERLRWGYKVREASWSSDSNVLALWIEGNEGDIVQLWTTGNYHWYLKQEISAPASSSGEPGRFTSVVWHPEQGLQMILSTRTEIIQRTYAWETFASSSQPPIDSGAIVVIDGTTLLLTPFRFQNVPPPMSSCKITLSTSRLPIHASFSSTSDSLAVLWESGYIELWSLKTRMGGGRGKVMDPTRTWTGQVNKYARQIQVLTLTGPDTSDRLVVISTEQNSDILTFLKLGNVDQEAPDPVTIDLPARNCRLITTVDHIACQDVSGKIYQYNFEAKAILPAAQFPEFCLQSQSVPVLSSPDSTQSSVSHVLYLGLATSGKLHIVSGNSSHVLASNATSFTVASGFVIFTTTAHEAKFVPLNKLGGLLVLDAENKVENAAKRSDEWETRRVERGSRIVVAVPSAMSLVLQMPRGNLETINPRPLVMEVVKQNIDAGNYRTAFFACRKHRIDLNVLVEHDQTKFLERIYSFVEQIHEVDHLNLFLTGVGRGQQSPETIAEICDAVRTELENKDLTKYVNSVLTAHVVKTPPDHEAALSILHRLRESDLEVVEDAVKYIIFLVDADQLFDTALGMYDFSLVLMIAQHAQKDPREYLPFLRELRALEKYYQRFKIDDHLKRHESALRNLSLAGPEHFDEAISYLELHRLHEPALKIWRQTDRYQTILELYGDYLFERREFRQAASVFVEANKPLKAMLAHEKALQWQELFYLAYEASMTEEEVVATGYRVAEDLASKKRHSEAARVLLDYSQDVREAVITLAQGNHISEARRIITTNNKPELTEEIIHPAILESCAQVVEDIGECQDQLHKQTTRLRELRIKKVEEPDAFYGIEDANLHNVDVMTDVSMAPTTFTRYTIAPSTASRTSKRSSRSKRKLERKVGSGRKGTIDEEEYLLKSVTKLATRFGIIQGEAGGILPHLLQFTSDHRREGLNMQQRVTEFGKELKENLEEIWFKHSEEPPIDSWAVRMEEAERNKNLNAIDKIPKPETSSQNMDWRINLFDWEISP